MLQCFKKMTSTAFLKLYFTSISVRVCKQNCKSKNANKLFKLKKTESHLTTAP